MISFLNLVPVTSGLESGGWHSLMNFIKQSHALMWPRDCFVGLAKK